MATREESAPLEPAEHANVLNRLLYNTPRQDWIAIGFHTYLWVRILLAPDSPEATLGRRLTGFLVAITFAIVVLVRSEIIRPGKLRALLYRVGLFAPMLGSYFALQSVLPGLAPTLLDADLWEIDRFLFGETPAVWMAEFNQQPIVEYISFFYWSYFFLMGIMLLPMLFFGHGRALHELMFAALVICAFGHVIYTLVPGAGPCATIDFAEPLDGGLFWGLIVSTVETAGAGLDIFPSLHTAYPSFFALFAFRYRRHPALRYTWPIVAFFAEHACSWHSLMDNSIPCCFASS